MTRIQFHPRRNAISVHDVKTGRIAFRSREFVSGINQECREAVHAAMLCPSQYVTVGGHRA